MSKFYDKNMSLNVHLWISFQLWEFLFYIVFFLLLEYILFYIFKMYFQVFFFQHSVPYNWKFLSSCECLWDIDGALDA